MDSEQENQPIIGKDPSFAGAVIHQEKIGAIQGSVENVPSRSVGHMDRGLLGPTQDERTNETRQHYGESPTFIDFGGSKTEGLRMDVNNVREPSTEWLTRQEVIELNNTGNPPRTGAGRAQTQ